jgi:hypothetical protein
MTTLEEKLNQLSPERRAKIQVRADQLMAEELSLRDRRPSTAIKRSLSS